MALMLRKNLNVRTGLTSQSNTPIVEIEQPAMLEQLENSTVYNPAVEGSKDSAQIERESASFDADEDHLTAETGLSDETLQLLLQFQSLGCRFADNINDGTKDIITSKTVCVSYTARDSQVIAETYRRLQEKAENAAQDYASQLESRVIQDLQGFDCINSCAPQRLKEDMFGALQRDGVVRLNHVLDADSCERCLESINRSLEEVDISSHPMAAM
ncbi:predicted protein [Phaeodactylum tricornutum CCAP 1055/1]|uniref:Uncharacterized protein n=2 Tax=Phaeodactylum tricornutum TaxID=2850 RepID=B7FW85_PHATC|nr:predicted protein [Phaeodactylum tricornutum CCAP 1055/1]EEC48940.1 predicted protein [Phaeodactylum tricornutum CCAP 1055/1]|eukprot:XP_002179117.1 predicted protein [Phaeodactylum tricornutum CCAP 1055/1]